MSGTTQRIALRRSFSLRVALGVFVLIATLAVYTGLAPELGAWRAIPLTFASAMLLALCAARYDAAQPAALRFGSGELSAWNRAGVLLAQGRVVGCAQWSGRLLVLALEPADRSPRIRAAWPSRRAQGRSRTVLLTADALPATVFRELSVLGRHAAGA
ncbi:hypothetical protein LJ656_20505 [Paraburkholderia sp. MMS20-SJTR3]|uniref:Toxin CptA n=1 Tax=Paraburkholderia sejongensis TaxID=2886946 RepID=A0ABS8JYJ8_9BURK|nr:hypothetical protein [Paraburkholderia sp. MMS20-SJTR3]MCC8394977.1 hypothetical protein [Paraburkholderia sp. MMS20-SJTR3]